MSIRRIFTLSDTKEVSPTIYNLRWNALIQETDWLDEELDCIAELRPGESFINSDGYKVTRQDS